METDKVCVKMMPLSPVGPKRCGVCDELLVIPPIYACNSVSFICGPCFHGYRYYLDDDELRAADNPVRQILYENFASRFLFFCSYYPHCQGTMAFHHEAKLHYNEHCIAKVFWIFKCPITRANRWFMRPDQHYCGWRFTRSSLFDNEIAKLMKHIRLLHSEYILERPHILNLKALLRHKQRRQLFLLSLEENGILAVLMTEITKTDIIFRCRVTDSEWWSRSKDPFECSITLVPPHERFRSMTDLKLDCLPLDHNDTEFPWHSLRFPIRHLIAETAFQINVFPRSIMLQAMPYLHRYKQMYSTIEEESKSSSEATLSNPESVRTDLEVLSIPSTTSDEQDFQYSYPELWGHDDVERHIIIPKKVKESIQSFHNNICQDTHSRCRSNEFANTGCDKPMTKRSTASVFCDRPANEIEKVIKKSSTSRNLFSNAKNNDPEDTHSENNKLNSSLTLKIKDFLPVSSSNSENLPEHLESVTIDISEQSNSEVITNGETEDSDSSITSSSHLDQPILFNVPSPDECKYQYEEIVEGSDPLYFNEYDVFEGQNNKYRKGDIIKTFYDKIVTTGTEKFDLSSLIHSENENIKLISFTHNMEKECLNIRCPRMVLVNNETRAKQTTKCDESIIEHPQEIIVKKLSTKENLVNIYNRSLKYSLSEGNIFNPMLTLEEDSKISEDSKIKFGITSLTECYCKHYPDQTNISLLRNSNEEYVHEDNVFSNTQIKNVPNNPPPNLKEESITAINKPCEKCEPSV